MNISEQILTLRRFFYNRYKYYYGDISAGFWYGRIIYDTFLKIGFPPVRYVNVMRMYLGDENVLKGWPVIWDILRDGPWMRDISLWEGCLEELKSEADHYLEKSKVQALAILSLADSFIPTIQQLSDKNGWGEINSSISINSSIINWDQSLLYSTELPICNQGPVIITSDTYYFRNFQNIGMSDMMLWNNNPVILICSKEESRAITKDITGNPFYGIVNEVYENEKGVLIVFRNSGTHVRFSEPTSSEVRSIQMHTCNMHAFPIEVDHCFSLVPSDYSAFESDPSGRVIIGQYSSGNIDAIVAAQAENGAIDLKYCQNHKKASEWLKGRSALGIFQVYGFTKNEYESLIIKKAKLLTCSSWPVFCHWIERLRIEEDSPALRIATQETSYNFFLECIRDSFGNTDKYEKAIKDLELCRTATQTKEIAVTIDDYCQDPAPYMDKIKTWLKNHVNENGEPFSTKSPVSTLFLLAIGRLQDSRKIASARYYYKRPL